MVETLYWKDDTAYILDQRLLPGRTEYLACRDVAAVARAIEEMAIRGAPAIGCAAAMGLALAALHLKDRPAGEFQAGFEEAGRRLGKTRPTAVNLRWAIERMQRRRAGLGDVPPAEQAQVLVAEAQAIKAEDIAACRAIGRFGAELIEPESRVLTHCNAGALATAGYGTALGVIRAAHEAGKRIAVVADETRPYLQGARLTAWELMEDHIPVTLIADNMAGHLMRTREIDCVVVGADRIAANGDTANKIGTYSVALLAHHHGLPFYVAAPTSTIDLSLASGEEIPIEERASEEVTRIGAETVAPEGVAVRYPAFDVTPAEHIHAIITERGVALAPFTESLTALVRGAAGE